ncbi:MAG: hypothetical protein QE263_05955 [Vampirovibrionales bacterium]|nr:hypothetical protein [Vampirovibrionales bacterium]
MGVFADPTAHSSFLATYLVRVLAYTAGMVVVLYIAAGLIKAKSGSTITSPVANPPITNVFFTHMFWRTLWQRFTLPRKAIKAPPAVTMEGSEASSQAIVVAKQTLPLDDSHTAHVLDSPDGRWLLVTGPTGTQLHALQGANNVDLGGRYLSMEHSTTPNKPVIKPPFGVPDGWGPVSMALNC